MAATMTQLFANVLRQRVNALPAQASMDEVNQVLRLLGQWRSQVLANTFTRPETPAATAVQGNPTFTG